MTELKRQIFKRKYSKSHSDEDSSRVKRWSSVQSAQPEFQSKPSLKNRILLVVYRALHLQRRKKQKKRSRTSRLAKIASNNSVNSTLNQTCISNTSKTNVHISDKSSSSPNSCACTTASATSNANSEVNADGSYMPSAQHGSKFSPYPIPQPTQMSQCGGGGDKGTVMDKTCTRPIEPCPNRRLQAHADYLVHSALVDQIEPIKEQHYRPPLTLTSSHQLGRLKHPRNSRQYYSPDLFLSSSPTLEPPSKHSRQDYKYSGNSNFKFFFKNSRNHPQLPSTFAALLKCHRRFSLIRHHQKDYKHTSSRARFSKVFASAIFFYIMMSASLSNLGRPPKETKEHKRSASQDAAHDCASQPECPSGAMFKFLTQTARSQYSDFGDYGDNDDDDDDDAQTINSVDSQSREVLSEPSDTELSQSPAKERPQKNFSAIVTGIRSSGLAIQTTKVPTIPDLPDDHEEAHASSMSKLAQSVHTVIRDNDSGKSRHSRAAYITEVLQTHLGASDDDVLLAGKLLNFCFQLC